jgi:uncharacterized membrane protein YeaQ/YmgE (transglycosylase-associated protein family)
LIVFAVIGLFVGAASRLLYPGREPLRILGTLLLGAVGGVLGGMISWAAWPEPVGSFYSAALLASLLGAALAIVAWAFIAYWRRIGAV